jgi:peptidoglycan/xylan/chitin deacetylase (PgdA/CDA1 family)
MIVTYHEVTSERSDYVYSVSTLQFEAHLTVAAALPPESREPLLTFDDGHASHRKYAAPALSRFGLRATFFVTAGWTGNRIGFMNGTELRELAALGHDIESHGWSHTLLTMCSSGELAAELRRSKSSLEDVLGRPVDAISIPGGRWNRRVLEQCAAEGYRRVFTSDPCPEVRRLYGLEIRGREMVRNTTTARELLGLLRAEPKMWSRPRLLFAAKRVARAVLGDSTYQMLWSRVGSSAQKSAIDREYQVRSA